MLDLAPYRRIRRKNEPGAEGKERVYQQATPRFKPDLYERAMSMAHAEQVSLNSLIVAATLAAVEELEAKHGKKKARHAG